VGGNLSPAPGNYSACRPAGDYTAALAAAKGSADVAETVLVLKADVAAEFLEWQEDR